MKRSVRHQGRRVDISRREGESLSEYRYRMRLLVIRHYMNGRKIGCQCEGCRCVGDRYLPFLQLDHVKGQGASPRMDSWCRSLCVDWDKKRGYSRPALSILLCSSSPVGDTSSRYNWVTSSELWPNHD
jgi:hypothetical protein